MNIPQDTLQQVADAAFQSSPGGCGSYLTCSKESCPPVWHDERHARSAVIQHALNNPAIAPFLAGGIGEYTDKELVEASNKAFGLYCFGPEWRRAFLSSLPRRESPALAEAIARAEKAEAELAKSREINQGLTKSCLEWEKIVQELKSAQLGILRPIAEMPETVPEGCVILYGNLEAQLPFGFVKTPIDTHITIIRLPDAEATPPVQTEPAAQVPLGPEDCPPGSVLKALSWAEYEWRSVSHVYSEGVLLDNCPTTHSWIELEANWQINTSIPDTGRWDANAWKPCSKPAGKEVAK